MPRDPGFLGRHYPANPAYGQGLFRRRLRMQADGEVLRAALNDPYHAMWIELRLGAGRISAVSAGMERTPKTTCPGAIGVLRELEGMAYEEARERIFGEGRGGRNCTHLLDLARFALGCQARGERARCLDLEVADPDAEGRIRLRAEADGRLLLSLQLSPEDQPDPGPVFTAMRAGLDGLALEALRALRMAVFVAAGRAYITDGPVPVLARDETERHGDCYAFSPALLALSRDNIGYVQDFSLALTEKLPAAMQAPATKETSR